MLKTIQSWMQRPDYYDIAKALEHKVAEQEILLVAKTKMLEEAEYAIEKALYAVYKTPYKQMDAATGNIIRDIEDTLSRMKDLV